VVAKNHITQIEAADICSWMVGRRWKTSERNKIESLSNLLSGIVMLTRIGFDSSSEKIFREESAAAGAAPLAVVVVDPVGLVYKGAVKRKFRQIKSVKNWGWINSQRAQEIIGIQAKASSLETPPNHRNDRALVKCQ
jgi:hypothetical protein